MSVFTSNAAGSREQRRDADDGWSWLGRQLTFGARVVYATVIVLLILHFFVSVHASITLR